ncbi:MAG: hypothetical protein DLM53_03335 [Candidatus Eremiobacter antarcticus]|nr:glycosyltransferase family 39 protein [Candidatus Eremiobacteraeota bacterium]MBC5809214.1 glycosyltransferase family 39 protein [Candidatus Eremiobacteraeota bacterium]PZR63806.1 MAG: hypothetical protein DLM53_03335 [Candidatus Eremiobacter sp. RRmetagenome_bin22]
MGSHAAPRLADSSRRGGLWRFAPVLVNLAITLPLANVLNTWVDESYTLRTTMSTPAYAFHQAIHFELQPPLYFVLLSVWRSIDHSVFFARLFSVICVALLVWVSTGLSERYVKNVHPAWLASVVALSPTAIWAATEIRVYALAMLLGGLLLLTFFDGYLSAAPSRTARFWFAALVVAAIYTQYFLAFIVLGCGAALLLFNRRTLRPFLTFLLLTAVPCLPIVFIVREQIASGTSLYYGSDSTIHLLRRVYSTLSLYVLPLNWLRPKFVWLLGLQAAIVAAYAAAGLRLKQLDVSGRALWLTTGIATLMLWAALAATREPFAAHYVSVIFVPAVLAVYSTIARAQLNGKNLLAPFAIAAIVCGCVTNYSLYRPLGKAGDWKRVASFVMASESDHQPILAFQSENALTFLDYYTGRNHVIAIPHPLNFQDPTDPGVILHSSAEIDSALGAPRRSPEVWALTSGECRYENVDYRCDIFEKYLKDHYVVVSRKEFFKSEVRLLRVRADSR